MLDLIFLIMKVMVAIPIAAIILTICLVILALLLAIPIALVVGIYEASRFMSSKNKLKYIVAVGLIIILSLYLI
jgi:hypothetical protein